MMENIDMNSKKKIEINLQPSTQKPANQPLAGNPQQPQINNNINNNNNNNYNLNNLNNLNNYIGNAKPLTPNNNPNQNLINLNNRSPLPNNINNNNNNNININGNYHNNINNNLARNNPNPQQNQIQINNGINGIRPSSAKSDPKARMANNYQNPHISPINNQKNNLNLNMQPNSHNSPIMINPNNNNNKGPVIASYNPINNMNLNQNRPGSGVATNNNNKDINSNVNNYLKKVNNIQQNQNQNQILAGNNYLSNNQQQAIKRPSSGRPDSGKGAENIYNYNNNNNNINRNNISPIRSPNNLQNKPALIGNYQSNPNRQVDKSPVILAKKPLIAAVDNSPKPLLRPQSGNPGMHNNMGINRPQSERNSNPVSNNNPSSNRKIGMPAANKVVIEKYDMNKLHNNNYNRVAAGNNYKPSTPINRPASGNANLPNNRNVVNNRNNVVMPASRGNANANIINRGIGVNKR